MSYAHAAATGEGQFQVRIQAGPHSFLMDEPAAVGGLDSGPNPFDLLCSALAGCTLITLRLYADRKGWGLDDLSVRVTHRQASAGGRDQFECVVHLGNVTDEQREGLLRIAQRCPVHLVLEAGADAPTSLVPGAMDELAA